MQLQEYAAIIAEEFDVTKRHAAALLRLFDDAATVPYIARYRKEATGTMTAATVRNIQLRYRALQELDERRAFILKSIKDQCLLTPELRERIEQAATSTQLEDAYQPWRPKRKTRAAAAYDLGLEPLAQMIRAQDRDDIETMASPFVRIGGPWTVDEAIAGALDIISEQVASDEKARGLVRAKMQRNGSVASRLARGVEPADAAAYQAYHDFSEPIRTANPQRYLAMRRGEEEGLLKVGIAFDDKDMTERLSRMFVRSTAPANIAELMRQAVAEGYRRLLRPSIDTELLGALKDRADEAAISAMADSLEQMLMMPPLGPGHRVLAIDAAYKEGCRVVVLGPKGEPLAADTIFPLAPANDFYNAAETLCFLVDRYNVDTLAIGSGQAGRDVERFLGDVQLPRRVTIFMVDSHGAATAPNDLPDSYDPAYAPAVSIGRRLLDPISELVKADPRTLVDSPFVDDVNQPRLREALDYTVEKCVNSIGVNLNTAPAHLLARVSGIGPGLAENIVKHRTASGPFKTRDELMEVSRMGEKTFRLCAGFVRITDGPNLLDNTGIHPDSYPLVWQIATDLNQAVERLARNRNLLSQIDTDRYTNRNLSLSTLTDIISELSHPGRDPRLAEPDSDYLDDMDPRDRMGGGSGSIRSIHDLHIGMTLTGKVNNITAFGVFVDLGIKENGLIHISQLSEDFVQSARDVVKIGQTVTARVIDVDPSRGRIALTLKP